MVKVKVVNRQVIDGKERERGAVVEVAEGLARDLIIAGKVTAHEEPEAKPAENDKPTAKAVEKGGK